MTPTVQWSIGLVVAAIMFAVGELIVSSRATDQRIGDLERAQDRQQERLIAAEERLDTHRDMLVPTIKK